MTNDEIRMTNDEIRMTNDETRTSACGGVVRNSSFGFRHSSFGFYTLGPKLCLGPHRTVLLESSGFPSRAWEPGYALNHRAFSLLSWGNVVSGGPRGTRLFGNTGIRPKRFFPDFKHRRKNNRTDGQKSSCVNTGRSERNLYFRSIGSVKTSVFSSPDFPAASPQRPRASVTTQNVLHQEFVSVIAPHRSRARCTSKTIRGGDSHARITPAVSRDSHGAAGTD